MTLTVGFILLTHNNPHQATRLISTINYMFGFPPIVCHHNFSESHFRTDKLPENVSFVRPHLLTAWGTFSIVEAMLSALQLMYESLTPPDWFVLLSGSDYPIKSAKKILHDLASTSYDVHMNYQQINHNSYKSDYERWCYQRYCCAKFPLPSIAKKILNKQDIILRHPFLTAPFVPFSKNFRCFTGDFWFCASRKAAEYLINFHTTQHALASHYRWLDPYIIFPDESYHHTVLCNASHLKISRNHWRYVSWASGECHPKTLMSEDLPKLCESSAHFARKFSIDADVNVLNELDVIVEIGR